MGRIELRERRCGKRRRHQNRTENDNQWPKHAQLLPRERMRSRYILLKTDRFLSARARLRQGQRSSGHLAAQSPLFESARVLASSNHVAKMSSRHNSTSELNLAQFTR